MGVMLLFQACDPRRATSSPEEEIREGWRLYRLSEFNSAVKIFQSVRLPSPGQPISPDALYGEASCWNHRRDGRDIAKAVTGYQAVVEEARKILCCLVRSGHRAHAASGGGSRIDYESLIRDYAEVYQRYPQSPAGEEAFLYAAVFHFRQPIRNRPASAWRKVNEFLCRIRKLPICRSSGLIAELSQNG
jgi:hypothetical protein